MLRLYTGKSDLKRVGEDIERDRVNHVERVNVNGPHWCSLSVCLAESYTRVSP